MIQFRVGMTCGGCEKAVRSVLSNLTGVKSVTIDMSSKEVSVTGTASKEECMSAIAKIGKSVEFIPVF
jgi:copper chaperone CopZ